LGQLDALHTHIQQGSTSLSEERLDNFPVMKLPKRYGVTELLIYYRLKKLDNALLSLYQDIEKWWETECLTYSARLFADSRETQNNPLEVFRVLKLEIFGKHQNGMKNWLEKLAYGIFA